MSTRLIGRWATAAAALLLASALAGVRALPSWRTGGPDGGAPADASVDELRAWVADEVDAVIEAVPVETRWRMLLDLELHWAEDRDRIFELSHLPRCSTASGRANPASVRVELLTDPLEEDPAPLIAPVRELWEAQGWAVSEVGGSPGYLRADRADGAFMTIEAAEARAGRFIALSVTSVCSAGAAY